jgi:hypothetical protein
VIVIKKFVSEFIHDPVVLTAIKESLKVGVKVAGIYLLIALAVIAAISLTFLAPAFFLPFFLFVGVTGAVAAAHYGELMEKQEKIAKLRDEWPGLSRYLKGIYRERFGLSGPEWD